MNKTEERKAPVGDPRFAFLEHGDADYKPLIQIRVTTEGQVFYRDKNRAALLEHVTVQDVEDLIKDRGQGEYQQYDFHLLSMNTERGNARK